MSNLITVQIEGPADQQGHLLLADFLERIDHLLSALNGVDRIVGQTARPTLNYRIVDAKHSSPLSITLQPIYRKGITIEGSDHIERRNKRFFSELIAIRGGESPSPEVDEPLLENFRLLVEGLGTDFSSATIFNGEASIELDRVFESKVRQLLREEDSSYGGEEGMLEAVNIHGPRPTCWIYPKIGATRVRCDFLPGMREQIRENVGRFVRVEGAKFFRPHSPFPFRISVKELIPIDEDSALHIGSLKGIASDATGELTAAEFVRKLRDEWE